MENSIIGLENMLSKCIKMPKYSFKRNSFFAIQGGVTLILPTAPHMHHIGPTMHRVGHTMHHVVHTMHHVVHTMHHVVHTSHCVGHTAYCVSHTEYDKKHSVTSSKFFLAFSWVKKKFFQNCLKLPKNQFITIKILFFSSFFAITSVDQTKSGKFQIFFLNPSLTCKCYIL